MRQHPIPPVTEPMQYRAIGVVRGVYIPDDPQVLTRGALHTDDGTVIEAVVLGRLLTLMRRHLDLAAPHLWVVYPRSRENRLHLQLVGVWEPSTLASPAGSDQLAEGDGFFSVRGELIYTRPESGDLVIKVRQRPRPDGSRPVPFKLQLRGDIPLEHLRQFVALELRRQGQELRLERCEVIGPAAARGNRGGRRRREDPSRPTRRGDGPGRREAAPDTSRTPSRAVSRPLR